MQKVQSILKNKYLLSVCIVAFLVLLMMTDRSSSVSDATESVVREAVSDEEYNNEISVYDDGYSLDSTIVENSEYSLIDSTTVNSLDDVPETAVEEAVTDSVLIDDLSIDEYVGLESEIKFDYSVVPDYSGTASVCVNDNIPFFTEKDKEWEIGLEVYPPVDELDRCRTVYACIGVETMPGEGEERGSIGMIKPSGWQTIKYPDIIEDLYLYNRCHLIGWQLGGENANEYNLITGTRYLNVSGMLPYENQVADYIHETGNHVIYRVSPYFIDNELVARGVLIEAESVEDTNLCFCVWCYNVQPGIGIDYLTGDSWVAENTLEQVIQSGEVDLVLNMHTMRAHLTTCSSVHDIKPENRMDYHGTIEEVQTMGYIACGNCHPF